MGLIFRIPQKFKPKVPSQSDNSNKQEKQDRVNELDKVIVKDKLPLSTTLQFAQEGETLPIVHGNRDVDVRGIWWGNYNKTNKTIDFAIGMTGNEIETIGKIWDMSKGGRLIFNNDSLEGTVSLNKYCNSLRIYKGTLTQEPDPRILSIEGENAPAWPGNSYLVVIAYKLEMTANKLPQWRVKIIGRKSDVPDATTEVYSYAVGVGNWNSLFTNEAAALTSFSDDLYLAAKAGGGDDPAIYILNESTNNFDKKYEIGYGTQPYDFAELDDKLYLALEDRVYEVDDVSETNTSLPNVNNITIKSMAASSSKLYVVVDNVTYNHAIYSYNGSSWTLEHEADQGITSLDVQAMVWHESNLYICHADASDSNKTVFKFDGADITEMDFDEIAYGAFSISGTLYIVAESLYYLDEETETFELYDNQISDIVNIGSDLIEFRNRLHLGALNNVRRECRAGEAWNKLVPAVDNFAGEFVKHGNKLYFMDIDNIGKPRQGNIVYTCHKEARYY